MTSMPASRRARAITFAPRSWPSRPGLAINTRIGRSGIRGSLAHARRFRSLGIWLRHRRAARPKGLDRAPDPSLALAPAARASSPLGDFARHDPDCFWVGERRKVWA